MGRDHDSPTDSERREATCPLGKFRRNAVTNNHLAQITGPDDLGPRDAPQGFCWSKVAILEFEDLRRYDPRMSLWRTQYG